jgi:hypothetical protein
MLSGAALKAGICSVKVDAISLRMGLLHDTQTEIVTKFCIDGFASLNTIQVLQQPPPIKSA